MSHTPEGNLMHTVKEAPFPRLPGLDKMVFRVLADVSEKSCPTKHNVQHQMFKGAT